MTLADSTPSSWPAAQPSMAVLQQVKTWIARSSPATTMEKLARTS